MSTADDRGWWGSGHRSGFKGRVLQTVVNPVRRAFHPHYDVYLQFLSGAHVVPAATADVRLLIPSGNAVEPDVAQRFDAIAMQAPDNIQLVPKGARSVLLPPPVFDLAPSGERPRVDLPDRYLLTVFNPYDPIKGVTDLARAADAAPLPFVWCHSQATTRFDIPPELLHHPRITHVTDASPAEIRYLYERCAAYVSFSLTEGFGWSTADALRYAPAVASRPIGVFSNQAAWQPGTSRITDDGEISWDELLAGGCSPDERDLDVLGRTEFRDRLAAAVEELRVQ
ncbi:glycosyltransferase [Janibacter sp. HTCC2649]|uniref:glycosyltransferase n=1 Tax=Janibacter sp. HTCC2649 TaxID=313589 RepID=UPI00192ABEEF|nr:glycosyltransferase [Janibacter sp. HTCC2649]